MSIHDYWKTIVLTIWNFVAIVMSLLFNTLSRFVIASFQGAYVLISWLQSLFPLFLHLFAMKWWNWILWPPDVKSWLLGKDPDAGKDWRQEEKGTTEDEMVGWHHRIKGWEFEQTLGVGDGLGGRACCSPWGHKESDTTEWLNWTDGTGCHDLSFSSVENYVSFFTLLFHLHQEAL